MTYSERVIADGASNYWRLGETSGTTAVDVIGGAHGTIDGGVTLGQPGALTDGDTAMTFDALGESLVTASVTIPGTHTIELWLRPTEAVRHRVFSMRPATSYILDVLETGQLQMYVGPFLTGVQALALATWHHVAVVFDGASLRFYINGALDVTHAVAVVPNVGPLYFSKDPPDAAAFWHGSLDEIAIYPRALTAAEILAHYGARLSLSAYAEKVITDGATAYWPLDDSSGTTARDLVGTRHAPITGPVTLAVPGVTVDSRAMGLTADVQILPPSFPALVSAFTLEAWIKLAAAPGGPTNPTSQFFLLARVFEDFGDFQWAYSVGELDFTQFIDGGGGTTKYVRYPYVLAVGVWTHLVMSAAAGLFTAYANGLPIATGPIETGETDAATGACGIGTSEDEPESGIDGAMQDVAIYQHALTPAQVSAHYAARVSGRRWPGIPWAQLGEEPVKYNVWVPITPSDVKDLPHGLSGGIWVGGGGDVAAVMQDGTMPVILTAVPAGAWLPVAAKRINSTGTTATGLVALYEN